MSHYIRQNPKKTKKSDKRWSLDEDQFIIDN